MNIKVLLSAVFVLGTILTGYFITGAIPKIGSDPFDNRPFHQDIMSVDFSFANKSELLGFPFEELKGYSSFDSVYVSIVDYNNDGFEDILWIYTSLNEHIPSKFVLLKNIKGERFEDVSLASGIAAVTSNSEYSQRISSAVFADFDNDGWSDLYVGRVQAPHFVLKNNHGTFILQTGFIRGSVYGKTTKGLNLFDYNRDGFVDVIATNFFDFKKMVARGWSASQILNSLTYYGVRAFASFDSLDGQPPVLLENEKGNGLIDKSSESGLNDNRNTWASGIGDFSDSGHDDLFFANDFGYDSFFKNLNGKKFSKQTAEALGPIRSRFSMSAEVGDVDNDGLPDIFVANASKPSSTRGFQSLWINKSHDGKTRFSDNAFDTGIDKCGFSWGSKFVDFNKDGMLDLFVLNGRNGNGTSPQWLSASWLNNVVPIDIRHKFPEALSMGLDPQLPFAGGQKNCVFLQKEKMTFIDVSEATGVTDQLNGRGLAVFDFNNDGQEDLILGNLGATPILYEGHRSNSNQWLGLNLIGRISNRDAIGAKVFLQSKNLLQTRSVFPANGFESQSSKRLVFGLQNGDAVKKLEIHWPSGKKQFVSNWKLNAYQTIYEE